MKYGKWEGYMGNIGIVVQCDECRQEIEIPDNHWEETERITQEYFCPNCGKKIIG